MWNAKKEDEKFMVSSIESRQCQIEYFHNERVVKEQGLLLDVKHALENSIKKFFLCEKLFHGNFLFRIIAGKNYRISSASIVQPGKRKNNLCKTSSFK